MKNIFLKHTANISIKKSATYDEKENETTKLLVDKNVNSLGLK